MPAFLIFCGCGCNFFIFLEMYTLELGSVGLSPEEKEIFSDSLREYGLDPCIWDLYARSLQVISKHSTPQIVRIYNEEKLCAHFYMVRCRNYGISITSSSLIKFLISLPRIPIYSWIRASIAAETNANPGFFTTYGKQRMEIPDLIRLLKKKYFMLFIHDHLDKREWYPNSLEIPYSDLGNIELSGYSGIQDYLSEHGNLKRKLRKYDREGGRVEILKGSLNAEAQSMVKHCILASSRRSIFSLPYQDIYPEMCRKSTEIDHPRFFHFICRSDEHFFGYHSFVRFNTHLRCMHGAFNRDLPTTYHAYENMIYRVVEYAIENRLQSIYFGPVLNETKRRMMNQFIPTCLYTYSKYPGMLKVFAPLLKKARMSNKQIRSYAGIQKQSAS